MSWTYKKNRRAFRIAGNNCKRHNLSYPPCRRWKIRIRKCLAGGFQSMGPGQVQQNQGSRCRTAEGILSSVGRSISSSTVCAKAHKRQAQKHNDRRISPWALKLFLVTYAFSSSIKSTCPFGLQNVFPEFHTFTNHPVAYLTGSVHKLLPHQCWFANCMLCPCRSPLYGILHRHKPCLNPNLG